MHDASVMPVSLGRLRQPGWPASARDGQRLASRVALFLVGLAAGAVWTAGVPIGRAADTGAPRPHILFILADDLGYQDVGFTGGTEIRTPNLDRLATAGTRLDQFYVLPVCSPTRAALLTGRYPMRYGLQTGVVRPWADYGLPLEERLLPQALKEAGYRTAIVGKWHLGHCDPAYLPTRRGFDHQYGHYNGAIDYFEHTRDGGFDWHRNDAECRETGYSTALLAKEAVRLIREQDARTPLFLYLAFNAVHAPHQVPEPYKAPYGELKEPRRTYAGMVAALDEAVGQVYAALELRGFATNTLIVFSSDNGGPAPGRVTDNGRRRAAKGTLYEGGVRVCAFATWPGRIPAGARLEQPVHIVDWYPTLLKLAGAPTAQRLPPDGRDLWATLTQHQPSPRDEILLNAEPHRGALRVGPWKLIVNGAAADPAPDLVEAGPAAVASADENRPGKTELFNLDDDPYERQNLAAVEPERVRQLQQRYQALARQAVPPKSKALRPGFRAPRVWGQPEP